MMIRNLHIGFGLTLAMVLGASANADARACIPVFTGGETEFVQRGHVPAWLTDPCFTFTVPQGKHVRMTVTREGDMTLGVGVREPGSEDYSSLVVAITSFSNAAPTGRFVLTETDTAPKDFQVSIGSDKREPDTSKEYTFRIVLEPAVPPEPPRRSASDRFLGWFGLR